MVVMAIQVVRFQMKDAAAGAIAIWGGLEPARTLTAADATISLDSVTLLSPVTQNQQFICQGTNYESHVRESGMDPGKIGFNTIFTKASSCITGPHDDVVRPRHVELLDLSELSGLQDLMAAVLGIQRNRVVSA